MANKCNKGNKSLQLYISLIHKLQQILFLLDSHGL